MLPPTNILPVCAERRAGRLDLRFSKTNEGSRRGQARYRRADVRVVVAGRTKDLFIARRCSSVALA